MENFTVHDIPNQKGRRVIITGATSGIGYETALALAVAGATVTLTGRNNAKGEAALANIRKAVPNANIRYLDLDLSDLSSVETFAEFMKSDADGIDLLVNNAGVMTPPTRHTTKDGFELQFGTNFLGHFALTARLMPLLNAGNDTRVVNLSSGAHRIRAAIRFDDLQWIQTYKPWPAYAQSKLATLLFAFELQRRAEANGWDIMSNASHPGWARTGLQTSGPGMGRKGLSIADRLGKLLEPLMSQSAADGALPTIFAATSPEARPSGYYGPNNLMELKGPVTNAIVGRQAQDRAVAARLWTVAEQLTGVEWFSKPASPKLVAG